jgi:hypothetical protein
VGWSTRAGAREREHPSAAHRALPAEQGSGADGPHDGLFSHTGVGGVWPAAHRGRWAPNIETTRDKGTTYPMFPGVLRHMVSPRLSPGPRTAVPQDIGCTHEHRRCSGPSSVPRRMVSTRLCQYPAHGQCPSPLLALRRMVGAPAHGRYASPWSVLWRMVGARPMVSAPAHYQCPSAWPVLRPIVGTQGQYHAHGRCSGAWSVRKPMVSALAHGQCPTHGQCSGPWSVPIQKTAARRPAPRSTQPNKGVQATPSSVRSAPASSSSSGLALDAKTEEKDQRALL